MLHYQTTSCPQLCQISEGRFCTPNTGLAKEFILIFSIDVIENLEGTFTTQQYKTVEAATAPSPAMPSMDGYLCPPPYPIQALLPGPEMTLTASSLLSLSWITAQSLAPTKFLGLELGLERSQWGKASISSRSVSWGMKVSSSNLLIAPVKYHMGYKVKTNALNEACVFSVHLSNP